MLREVECCCVYPSCEVFDDPGVAPKLESVGFEAALAWRIDTADGRKIGKAAEVSGWCGRCCCGATSRPLSLYVWAAGATALANPLLRLERKSALPACCGCCCCCGHREDCCEGDGCGTFTRLQRMDVFGFEIGAWDAHTSQHGPFGFDEAAAAEGPPRVREQPLGSITQQGCRGCGGPRLVVADRGGAELFTIDGPCLTCEGCCCELTLEVRVAGEAVGEFCRLGELGRASLRMPALAPALPHRAMLLGALFLVELVFFGEGPAAGRAAPLHHKHGAAVQPYMY